MRREGRSSVVRAWTGTLALIVCALSVQAAAAVKPRTVLILPYQAQLSGDEEWLGEGVTYVLSQALAQHPAFIQVDRSRLARLGAPHIWGEAAILNATRSLKADLAFFGDIQRASGEIVFRPRYLEPRVSPEARTLEPLSVPADKLLDQLAGIPLAYFRVLRVQLTDAEISRIEKVSRPTASLRAFETFVRGRIASMRGTQQGHETAADLFSKAVELDPSFVVAQYSLGVVHQALGNRWKAAAQFRASTQLDPTYPEPFKALGDLFLSAPRRLFDQAVEAYQKALELRPFYADAHVGLGDAKAAKGDVDAAVAAYQRALVYNPVNPRVHLSLGKIYYNEKGLYYEAVAAFKKAIELDPEFLEARMGLGEVYEDKGLYQDAIAEYRKVVETEARHTGALYNLALVYEKVDAREAIAHWERYIAVASQIPSEKDWVDVARQHLKKLKSRLDNP
ncbi:MAG: tetratricopeptide repeat protein [Candidatus Rokubacteria bacterium]|nr:tetratricopeptide repeat protein [Candidatus Rokubacteria bacterium]